MEGISGNAITVWQEVHESLKTHLCLRMFSKPVFETAQNSVIWYVTSIVQTDLFCSLFSIFSSPNFLKRTSVKSGTWYTEPNIRWYFFSDHMMQWTQSPLVQRPQLYTFKSFFLNIDKDCLRMKKCCFLQLYLFFLSFKKL